MATAPYTLEQAEEAIADLRAQVDRMTEAHSVADGGMVPNTPDPANFTLYSSQGQPSWVNPAGATFGTVGAGAAFFPNNTVTTNGNLGAYTVMAGDPDAGSLYEVELWGNGQGGSIGNRQTLAFFAQVNGTSQSSIQFGSTALPDTQAFFRFHAVVRVAFKTVGVAGTYQTFVKATISQLSTSLAASVGNSNFASGTSCESTSTPSLDTTAGFDIGVTAGWGSATGAPTLTSRVAFAKRWS